MELVLKTEVNEEIVIQIPSRITKEIVDGAKALLSGRKEYVIVSSPFSFHVHKEYDDVLDILNGLLRCNPEYDIDSLEFCCLSSVLGTDWREIFDQMSKRAYTLVPDYLIPWTAHPSDADWARYIVENGLDNIEVEQGINPEWKEVWDMLESDGEWFTYWCSGHTFAVKL